VYLTEYGMLQARRAGQVRARAAGGTACNWARRAKRRLQFPHHALPHASSAPALTRTGVVQDIKRRGTKFDAIFVSHMRRARQTCQLVMEECDPDCALPHQIDHRLAEKSFGIFAGRNINVLRMVRASKSPRWRICPGVL